MRGYPIRLLQEWADITLAAIERHGRRFFKRSPQAYFIDNVRHAAAGQRTPPDWWHQLRKSEHQVARRSARLAPPNRKNLPTSAAEILQSAAGDRTASMNEAVRSLFRRQN